MDNFEKFYELIQLPPNGDLHLQLERSSGTGKIPYIITSGNQICLEGDLDIELDDEAQYVDELTEQILDYCLCEFETVTEYDSLVSRTNPYTFEPI